MHVLVTIHTELLFKACEMIEGLARDHMTILAGGFLVFSGQLKPGALRVIEFNVLLEVGRCVTIRAGLFMQNRPELTDVDVFMTVDAKLFIKTLEPVDHFFAGSVTILTRGPDVFSG